MFLRGRRGVCSCNQCIQKSFLAKVIYKNKLKSMLLLNSIKLHQTQHTNDTLHVTRTSQMLQRPQHGGDRKLNSVGHPLMS